MLVMRKQHSHLSAVIILKSILALLNTHRTGRLQALFVNLEAARTPAFPSYTRPCRKRHKDSTYEVFQAADVLGPTYAGAINRIEIKSEETVLALLNRMQTEQAALDDSVLNHEPFLEPNGPYKCWKIWRYISIRS